MKDILEILQAIQSTPLPILLSGVGLFLLILAFVGKIGAIIELPPTRQRPAIITGVILVTIGIGLFTVPKPQSPTTALNIPSTPNSVSTPTAPECRLDNLINCSASAVPISGGKGLATIKREPGNVMVNFNNDQDFSGVAFLFTPALDVQGFTHVDIRGTATQGFSIRIEYKVHEGSEVKAVTSSEYRSFPATTQLSTIQIPLKYDGSVNEIALMFHGKGESSQVAIESIRLAK